MTKPVFIHTIFPKLLTGLLAYGLLAALVSLIHPVPGILLAILGAGILAALFIRVYAGLIKTNMELDRACRTRLPA